MKMYHAGVVIPVETLKKGEQILTIIPCKTEKIAIFKTSDTPNITLKRPVEAWALVEIIEDNPRCGLTGRPYDIDRYVYGLVAWGDNDGCGLELCEPCDSFIGYEQK